MTECEVGALCVLDLQLTIARYSGNVVLSLVLIFCVSSLTVFVSWRCTTFGFSVVIAWCRARMFEEMPPEPQFHHSKFRGWVVGVSVVFDAGEVLDEEGLGLGLRLVKLRCVSVLLFDACV